jgi:hypothetical protein
LKYIALINRRIRKRKATNDALTINDKVSFKTVIFFVFSRAVAISRLTLKTMTSSRSRYLTNGHGKPINEMKSVIIRPLLSPNRLSIRSFINHKFALCLTKLAREPKFGNQSRQ